MPQRPRPHIDTTPKIPFTRAAYEKMRDRRRQLNQLHTEVMQRLKDAREQGDLSENGAYKYAKFELGNIRRELGKLSPLLANGVIVEPTTVSNTIDFGRTITISADGQPFTFMLVSKHESDPSAQKLSTDSPIGAAVEGKRPGDTVTVQTPTGEKIYSIVSVS